MLLLCNRTIVNVSICKGTSNKCLELEKVYYQNSVLTKILAYKLALDLLQGAQSYLTQIFVVWT